MKSRIPTAVVLFAVLAVLFAGSAQAAGPLTYADDKGDALGGQASMDIVSVTFDTRQVNRTGPKSLVFELELAAPPETGTHVVTTYMIRTVMNGCGFQSHLHRDSAYSHDAFFYMRCLDLFLPAEVTVDKNVVQWTISLNELPEGHRKGALGSIRASTSIDEPVLGYFGTGSIGWAEGPRPIDLATTKKTWSY